jgi:hypothetical protein
MKTMIKRTVMGTAIALAAMGANAANISMTPDAGVDLSNITIGQTFNLTVQGDGFTDGIAGFQLAVTWDTSKLQLESTVADISASVASNLGGGFGDIGSALGAGSLEAAYVNVFGSFAGSTFDLFSLSFKAIPPPSNSQVTTVSAGGLIDGVNFGEYLGVNYDGANVTVTTNEVPLPAAVWLFGTGLLGLAGVARRRNPAEAAAA